MADYAIQVTVSGGGPQYLRYSDGEVRLFTQEGAETAAENLRRVNGSVDIRVVPYRPGRG